MIFELTPERVDRVKHLVIWGKENEKMNFSKECNIDFMGRNWEYPVIRYLSYMRQYNII